MSSPLSSPLSSAAEPSARVAKWLWSGAAIVLAMMPVGMAVAHRSSPVFLIGAAIMVLWASVLEGRAAELHGKVRGALVAPLGLAGLAFFGWTLVSIGWSAFPGISFAAFGEFWFPVLAALTLGVALPGRMPRWGGWLLAASIALACIMILFELSTGLGLRRDLGLRSASYIFNRPVLTILVCLTAVLPFLAAQGAKGWLAGGVAAALALAAVSEAESGAAIFGLAAGSLAFALSCIAPQVVRRAAMAATIVVFAISPLLGALGDRLIPASVHETLSSSHSRDRIDVWISFGAVVRAQPILGGGFGVSPRMAETPVAAAVPPPHRILLGASHPHNAAIQIWAELGIIGAVLAATILILVLRSLDVARGRRAAAMLALLGGVAAVSLVGHGAWQGWWAAAVGAAIVWFRSLPSGKDEAS
jgi:exopolysaccharide production protein ExoQ